MFAGGRTADRPPHDRSGGLKMEEQGFGPFEPGRPLSRRSMLRKTAFTGALASMPLLAAACDQGTGGGATAAGGSGGNFPSTPEYNFVFVNHVTTNPFFVPTQYGIEDAQALVGTTSQWTGSENSIVREMVDALNTAISGNADGIAVSVVDPT